jgi:hypothetical protein
MEKRETDETGEIQLLGKSLSLFNPELSQLNQDFPTLEIDPIWKRAKSYGLQNKCHDFEYS